MDVPAFLLFYAAMLINAVVFSALGLGGGVLYTPIQLLFGIEFHAAAATSLFFVMVTSLSSAQVFQKAGKMDWPMALVLESSTTLGAFFGGLWSRHLDSRVLVLIFSGVAAVAAIFLLRSFAPFRCPAGSWWAWRRQRGDDRYCINLLLALPLCGAAGLVSGMIGIAGGTLKVPIMILLLGVPAHIAVGTSSFMVGLTAAAGFLGHWAAGHVHWRVALLLAPGVLLGGHWGARISLRTNQRRLKSWFGYFMLALAAFLFWRSI